MKASRLFWPTLRKASQEAEMKSHQLLLRGAFIRKLTSGVYSFLPLGQRVLHKVKAIAREEMDRVGGQEVLLPALQPRDIWEQTGRWNDEDSGLVKMKLKDREGREFCLGPTHEEVITLLVGGEAHSYKDFPLLLYQIQTKFRDEPRPRGGLLRTKEFIMKDMYSLHATDDDLDDTFQALYGAYERILERCGLPFRVVEAEGGAIGGSETREFMVPAQAGEDVLVECPACAYAENRESARRGRNPRPGAEELLPLQEVSTPAATTIEQVSSLLQVPPDGMVKTLIFRAGDEFVAALVRGDKPLHERKLARHLGVEELEMVDGEAIERLTGGPMGFSGPVGLEGTRIVADYDLEQMSNFVVGSNREDAHLINANLGRDFEVEGFADLRNAEAGDPCPACGDGLLTMQNCIEVGHIFKLGRRYSAALGAFFQDEHSRQLPITMGCYGLGVTRLLSAVVEEHNDDQGICWPLSLAPFEAVVLQLDMSSARQSEAGQSVYRGLKEAGAEVLFDDRPERAGVKFHDAELVGIPLQVIVGRVTEREGKVEVAERTSDAKTALSPAEAVNWAMQRIEAG